MGVPALPPVEVRDLDFEAVDPVPPSVGELPVGGGEYGPSDWCARSTPVRHVAQFIGDLRQTWLVCSHSTICQPKLTPGWQLQSGIIAFTARPAGWSDSFGRSTRRYIAAPATRQGSGRPRPQVRWVGTPDPPNAQASWRGEQVDELPQRYRLPKGRRCPEMRTTAPPGLPRSAACRPSRQCPAARRFTSVTAGRSAKTPAPHTRDPSPDPQVPHSADGRCWTRPSEFAVPVLEVAQVRLSCIAAASAACNP